jgi:hypothetical protein
LHFSINRDYVPEGPRALTRKGNQGGSALNPRDLANLLSQHGGYVGQVLYLDLDSDIVGPHHFVSFCDPRDVAQNVNDSFGRPGKGSVYCQAESGKGGGSLG